MVDVILIVTVDANPYREVRSPHGDREQRERGSDEGQRHPQNRLGFDVS